MLLLASTPAALAETLTVTGKARTYEAQWAPAKGAPLVIILHGNTQSGASMVQQTSWPGLAKRHGFSAVYPDGLGRAWADHRAASERGRGPSTTTAEDVAFITGLIQHAIATHGSDAKRVYITGASNGGAMTMTMVCERPDLFAGAAPVIINLTATSLEACRAKGKPPRATPFLLMNGTKDPLVPYEGGKGNSRFAPSGFISTQATVSYWRERNGCASAPTPSQRVPNPQSKAVLTSSKCPANADVALYTIEDGGHTMPRAGTSNLATKAAGLLLGPQNHDIDGPTEIWKFFEAASKR